jgi:hypothetical protein
MLKHFFDLIKIVKITPSCPKGSDYRELPYFSHNPKLITRLLTAGLHYSTDLVEYQIADIEFRIPIQ